MRQEARAQTGSSILYTSGTYAQNFDGLPTVAPSPDLTGSGVFAFGDPTVDGTGMAGWYGDAALSDAYYSGSGSSPTQGFYGFATSPSAGTEALGMIANSLSGAETIGLLLVNNTQSTIFDDLSISFIGELWNYGGAQNATSTMSFRYQEAVDPQAPLPANGGNLSDGNLSFFYTNPNSTPGAVNGTLSANQTPLSDTVDLATPWTPGESLWLTWSILSPIDFSPGVAIADLSFAASGTTMTDLVWTGSSNSNWDTSSDNWTGGTYSDGSYVTFGTPPVSGSDVVVTADGVSPGHIAVTNSTGTYTFSGGSIGGSGYITKTGSGAVVLGSSNSYSGGTVIDGGTVVADGGDDTLGAAGVEVIFGGGQLETAGVGIVSSRNFAVDSGGGSFNSNGFDSSTSGSLEGNGTFTKTGVGNLTITGSVGGANIQSPTLSVLGGSLTLNEGAPQYFNVPTAGGAFAGNLVFGANTQADIIGSTSSATPGLISGGGSVLLAGSNNNTIDVVGATPFSPAYLEIDDNIVLNSGSAAQPYTATFESTTGTYGNQLTLGGVISGASSVNFTGPNNGKGVFLLNNTSSYSGDTEVTTGQYGVVRLGVDNALPTTTQLTFGSGEGATGALDLNSRNQTLAGLIDNSNYAAAGIVNTGTSTSTLTIDQSFDSTYNSTIGTPASPNLYGAGTNLVPKGVDLNNINLVKQGPGVLELTSTSLYYSGSTQVNGGSLIVDGNISGSSGVTVGAGGTLAGFGTVFVPNGGQVVVNNGATLSPGDNYAGGGDYLPTGSMGILDSSTSSSTYSSNGTFSLKSGGTLALTLGATTPGGSQQTNNYNNNLDSQLYVQGTISLAGNLSLSLLNDFTTNTGDLFFIILNLDPNFNESTIPVDGAFANAPSTISAPGPNGTVTFDVGYTGNADDNTFTGGNDVVLEVVSVPEPGAIPCCLGAVGIVLAFRRRRAR